MLHRLIINIGIISVKAYSLYCDPWSIITFNRVPVCEKYYVFRDYDVTNMAPYLYIVTKIT